MELQKEQLWLIIKHFYPMKIKNQIRKIAMGFSLTAVMFTFQACYGSPRDFGLDVYIAGKIISEKNGLPVEGIKISVPNEMQHVLSDQEGYFSFYTVKKEDIKIQFERIDPDTEKTYLIKDTVLQDIEDNRVFLDIALDNK